MVAKEQPVELAAQDGRRSAEAAAGDLADHFRYGIVTGQKSENLTERQFSDFLYGRTRPTAVIHRIQKAVVLERQLSKSIIMFFKVYACKILCDTCAPDRLSA